MTVWLSGGSGLHLTFLQHLLYVQALRALLFGTVPLFTPEPVYLVSPLETKPLMA